MAFVEAYKSHNKTFAWIEEATYRTRPANIDSFLKIIKQTDPWPVREIEQVWASGFGRAPAEVDGGMKWKCEGSFTAEVLTGEFLGAILGKVTTTFPDPEYSHVVSIDELGSFSVQPAIAKTGTNLVPEFLGCRVNNATFKASEENPKLMLDVDYQAATPQDGGTTIETVTPSSTPVYRFKQGVLTSTDIWGGQKNRFHGFELPVKNNCEPEYAGGYEFFPYEISYGKFEFGELKLTVGNEDDTEWNQVLDETDESLDYSVLFTRGATDTMNFAGTAKLASAQPNYDNNNVRSELLFIPETLTVTVVDSIATYPYE